MIQEKNEINPSQEAEFLLDLTPMMDKKVTILGASGQVGRHLLSILEANKFPKEKLTLIASRERNMTYRKQPLQCMGIDSIYDQNYAPDIIFNCAPASVIKENLWTIWRGNVIIIDKSSAFRMDEDIPLVVPEINGHKIKGNSLISSPNCVAIPLCIALHTILPHISSLSHIAVSTYQSVSGAGNKGMKSLLDEISKCMLQINSDSNVFEKQIAFNVIPKIGKILENRSTEEEDKVIQETKKILEVDLPMSVTCVRVPVLSSHSIVLQIACEVKNFALLESALQRNPAIRYYKELDRYCTPIEATLEDQVFISRLRRTPVGLSAWICCDNRNKGAALNAIQIALKKLTEYPDNNSEE